MLLRVLTYKFMFAFTVVSRAFQILSDSDKKMKYDKFGGDPDSRFSAASSSGASPFSGFASQRGGGQRGPMFEEEISPEELFRQFFGGGMGGPFGGPFGGMGGGPGFVFNMGGGGPGIRVHQFGGGQPRRRPHNHENAQPASLIQAMSGLLPLLLLFVLPILSGLFSGNGTSSGPTIRLDKASHPHTELHTSHRLSVPYWVNPTEVKDFSNSRWKSLDKYAENRFVQSLSSECEFELGQRARLVQEAQGFFYVDQVKMERANKYEMPNCRKLESYGYRLPGY
jgi:DnaJ family protein B protein 12